MMPTLIVETPPGHDAERAYILDVLLTDMLGLSFSTRATGGHEVVLHLAERSGGPVVVVPDVLFATAAGDWLTEETMPPEPLRFAAVPAWAGTAGEELPVLYGAADAPACVRTPGGVRFSVDLFGGAFFALTRLEEVVRPECDAHGRFPARASLAWRSGYLERPIVDEYVDLLWAAMQACWPGLLRGSREPRIWLSHDVDHPFATLGVPARAVLRQGAGDLVRRRDPRLAIQRLRSLRAAGRGNLAHDPYNTFAFLMDVSERHSLRSAFYFICEHDGGPFTASYEISDSAVVDLVATIAGRGHEIGLHGSYDSLGDPEQLATEFARLGELASLLGIRQERWGGRQHYLRWQSPASWEDWEQAGLDYDSSVGYADLAGFRSGTCHEHRVFSLTARRPLQLRERPLIAMEATLLGYMQLAPDAACELAVRLARRCRRHRGDFTLLCHNSSLAGRAAQDWYQSLVEEVARP